MAKKSFGQLLTEGAKQALAHKRGELKNAKVTRPRLTARRVAVSPPPSYAEDEIRRLRRRLGVSQAVFAELIGASRATVRAWEAGTKRPSGMARRILEIADRNPEVLEEDLRELVGVGEDGGD